MSSRGQGVFVRSGKFFPFAGLLLGLVLSIAVSTSVSAGGIYDSGGGAGGGGGGAQSSNGWGWYRYDLSKSTKPSGFRNGDTWGDIKDSRGRVTKVGVANRCRAVNATHVFAFIVLTEFGSDANKGVVYKYTSDWNPSAVSQYRGKNGGSWSTIKRAKTAFEEEFTSSTDRAKWASDIAWFCYNRGSFTLNPVSYLSVDGGNSWITGAEGQEVIVAPGATIKIDHHVSNTGTVKASVAQKVRSYKSGSGWGSATVNEWVHPDWSDDDIVIMPGTNNPWKRGVVSNIVPRDAPKGMRYCESVGVSETTSTDDSNIYSKRICYTAGEYDLSVKSFVNSGAGPVYVDPGTTVNFDHKVSNGGNLPGTVGAYLYQSNNSAWTVTGPGSRTIPAGGSWDRTTESYTLPADASVGQRFCRKYKVDRKTSTNGSDVVSSEVCAVANRVFTLTPSISITSGADIDAPGQKLTWNHGIKNAGPSPTTGAIVYGTYNKDGLGDAKFDEWTHTQDIAKNGSLSKNTEHTITQDDVGKSLCRITYVTPSTMVSGSKAETAKACRDIPYDYILTPHVDLNATTAEAGTDVEVGSSIANSGPTKSLNTDWVLSRIRIPSGGSVPTINEGSQDPCTYYKSQSPGAECSDISSGSNVVFPPDLRFPSTSATVPDWPVGTKVCFGLSIKNWTPWSPGNNQWRHSDVKCIVISKRPKTQVVGGDLFVGRGASGSSLVSTSIKVVSGKQYGSWSQYGILSSGVVNGMASAAGYSGGVATSNMCGVSNLTFGNRSANGNCSQGDVGRYIVGGSAPSIASHFPVTGETQQISGNQNINDLTAGQVYTAAANATLSLHAAQPIAKGDWYVINAPDATVTISGDITYTSDVLDAVSDIPQVVIIARNIIIANKVGQVDAWLVASGSGADGRVNTCGAGEGVGETTTLTAYVCDGTLRVNGPVVANKLLLRRTAGAGTGDDSGDPAEVFNLRPDAYLWATSLLNANTKVRTVLSTELPPRY